MAAVEALSVVAEVEVEVEEEDGGKACRRRRAIGRQFTDRALAKILEREGIAAAEGMLTAEQRMAKGTRERRSEGGEKELGDRG